MNKSQSAMNNNPNIFLDVISWFFGILFLAIATINMIWGNDFYFGLFLALLSFAFFPPVTGFVQKKLDIRIPGILKVALGMFIIFAAMGVGELPEKIEMMLGK